MPIGKGQERATPIIREHVGEGDLQFPAAVSGPNDGSNAKCHNKTGEW
jgi:hypothetical protein